MYAARRHLGMSWKEWRDTPWWVQRLYVEGMVEEELIQFKEPDWTDDPLGASVDDFTKMGLQVIRGG
jgi:hypothetical protein